MKIYNSPRPNCRFSRLCISSTPFALPSVNDPSPLPLPLHANGCSSWHFLERRYLHHVNKDRHQVDDVTHTVIKLTSSSSRRILMGCYRSHKYSRLI
ncbi:hypothetical protein F2P79_000254 [Pimephales promelas]|nr:hypothetical protein F2P79_000254 [Pimephales promelas]